MPTVRSPELMSRHDSGLLVVDVQDKLLAGIADSKHVVWNIRRLMDGARILGLPTIATEQYPEKLGHTTEELAPGLAEVPSKLTFSCVPCEGVTEHFRDAQRHKVLVTGVETHVCIQQTVLDLLSDGFQVYIPADAVSSRFPVDHETALRRMEQSGATITTTEAALFEWCEAAGSPEFKLISGIVRESAPD